MNASITFSRLPSFLGFSSVVASAISWRRSSRICGRSIAEQDFADRFGTDAGGEAVLTEFSIAVRYSSSLRSCFSERRQIPAR
jgi:hypothetical protein